MAGPISAPISYISNGQGGLMPSSAGSAMIMALAEDLKNSPAHVDVPDHKLAAGRQARVDRYLAKNNGVSEYDAKSVTVILPRVASPQRLYTTYHNKSVEDVARKRTTQFKELDGSFIGGIHDKFHIVIDKAIKETKQLEAEILSRKVKTKGMFSAAMSSLSKNSGLFTDEEKNEAFRPIENTINSTNKWLKSQDYPVRLVWRRVVEPNNQWSLDTWLVFANSPEQASEGISSWLGATDVVNPRDRFDKSDGRFDMYLP